MLEYADYNLLVQTSVNSYIAVKDGEIKSKGMFLLDYELSKNKSGRIIPMALQEFFVNNIPVEKTIKDCTNIFEFTLGAKSIGKNRLFAINKKTLEEKALPKITRYYISKNGVQIVKRLPKLQHKQASFQIDIFGVVDEGIRQSKIEANSLQTVYNHHVEKPIDTRDINYNYYIEKCNEIINKIITN